MVGLGGVAGTACRAALADAWSTPAGQLPWATLTVNLTGAFALGLLLEMLTRGGRDAGGRRVLRLAAGTGFLGSYTTYSSFAVETTRLSPLLAGGYLLATVLVGLAAAAAGFALGRRLTPGTAS